jgi:hypothetical protein
MKDIFKLDSVPDGLISVKFIDLEDGYLLGCSAV